jgi:hypothetical protein
MGQGQSELGGGNDLSGAGEKDWRRYWERVAAMGVASLNKALPDELVTNG